MKTVDRTSEIVRSGVASTSSFNIKPNAKAFRILSDGIYSDKILAVVRELSSNAYDAHIANGNEDEPFHVHLPNELEPFFTIRDYGIGLSHEDVINLYSTYFDSTKSNSNEFTGALGLGSKSPFSYTESFTVSSYFNGEKRMYIIDFGEEGIPQISLVDGFPWDTLEPNGLEISMAVDKKDFDTFCNRAKKVYRLYKTTPEVVGGYENFEIPKIKWQFEGAGWQMASKEETRNMDADIYAVQGTVAYPVDTRQLRAYIETNYSDWKFADAWYYGLPFILEVEFPIGDLEIATSRESLGYDERTLKNLAAKYMSIIDEIAARFLKEFDECKTLWEANLKYREFIVDGHNLVKELLKNKVDFKGEQVDGSITVRYDKFKGKVEQYKTETVGWHERKKYRTRLYQSTTNSYTKQNGTQYIYARKDAAKNFVIDDLDGKGHMSRRVNFYARTLHEKTNTSDIVHLLRFEKPADIRYFASQMDLKASDLVYTSQLEVPKPEKKTATKVGYLNVAFNNGSNTYQRSMKLDEGKGYYVALNNWDHGEFAGLHLGCDASDTIDKLYNALKQTGLIKDDEVVVGVNKSNIRHFKADKNWKPIASIKPKLRNYVNKNEKEFTEILDKSHFLEIASGPYNDSVIGLAGKLLPEDSNHLFRQIVDTKALLKGDKARTEIYKINIVSFACKCLSIRKLADIQNAIKADVGDAMEECLKKYPMVKLYLDTAAQIRYTIIESEDYPQRVADYINLIDSKEKV